MSAPPQPFGQTVNLSEKSIARGVESRSLAGPFAFGVCRSSVRSPAREVSSARQTESAWCLPTHRAGILKQNLELLRSNAACTKEQTYVGTAEGWLYAASAKDLFNGEIAGYAMHERMAREFIDHG
ncbi:hypothetical protein [Caballeronia sp. AAUFL_F1_KS47]|uniref:hypothetical protein n=1 Tax=Caballeronia sp. AAUFL_F1_KS47 TaxID=2921771 RepID=UPI0020296A62|nr:hypothetical protein [Caballeronia sp. AAUFL_F1_KS47]